VACIRGPREGGGVDPRHGRGHWFKSSTAHQVKKENRTPRTDFGGHYISGRGSFSTAGSAGARGATRDKPRPKSRSGRIARVTHTRTAKTVRFVIEQGVGNIPVAGMAAGPGIAALDSFILDKLAGKPGPVSFIGKRYPSIFQGADVSLSELLDSESVDGSD
jgi:hypothetical protein